MLLLCEADPLFFSAGLNSADAEKAFLLSRE